MTKAKQKEESTELASWQQDLAVHAKAIAHNEGSDSSAIAIQHGTMMYHDQPVPNNELDVIIIASITEHCYYDGPYDPDNISSPACFSQSLATSGATPHENVAEPVHEECDSCPRNRFRDGGFDKARAPKIGGGWCKEYRKVIMIPADTQAEDVPQAEMAYMKISPTSIKNWQKYAQQLVSSAGIPPWAATTKVKVVPDKKTIHQILFTGIAPLEDQELLAAIHGRIGEAEDKLMQPYTYDEEEAESTNY